MASAESAMIPVENVEHYSSKRHRNVMAEATADLAVRNIHLEMAQQCAKLAGESHAASISVLGPSAGLMPEQLVMSISTVMKPQHKAFVGRIDCASTTQVTSSCT